jgi:hypothetical protein
MIRRLVVRASMTPIALTYRAWGRRWIDDDQCRAIVTWLMRTTLWLVRQPAPDA